MVIVCYCNFRAHTRFCGCWWTESLQSGSAGSRHRSRAQPWWFEIVEFCKCQMPKASSRGWPVLSPIRNWNSIRLNLLSNFRYVQSLPHCKIYCCGQMYFPMLIFKKFHACLKFTHKKATDDVDQSRVWTVQVAPWSSKFLVTKILAFIVGTALS